MKVVITKQFEKDVERELTKDSKLHLADVIEQLRNASSLKDVFHLKKMKGYKTAYRIRMGEYRIGFILEDDSLKLSRVMNRKDIYKYFP